MASQGDLQFCAKFDTIARQYDKYYEKLPVKPHEVEADFRDLTDFPMDDEGDTFKVEDVNDEDNLK